MAVSMLDLCYEDSVIQAFHALNKKMQDFNNRTVVEIAKMGNNKFFIAHPCCQKWLAQRWLGCLQIRELDWGGHIKLPDWLKVGALMGWWTYGVGGLMGLVHLRGWWT